MNSLLSFSDGCDPSFFSEGTSRIFGGCWFLYPIYLYITSPWSLVSWPCSHPCARSPLASSTTRRIVRYICNRPDVFPPYSIFSWFGGWGIRGRHKFAPLQHHETNCRCAIILTTHAHICDPLPFCQAYQDELMMNWYWIEYPDEW